MGSFIYQQDKEIHFIFSDRNQEPPSLKELLTPPPQAPSLLRPRHPSLPEICLAELGT